ncbi:MAG: hypothetical protein AB1467_02320 [Candidatus Diapherotrites archaeon]
MNDLVFDSSALISISENCLMKVLGELSQKAIGNFYISEAIARETVNVPLSIDKFELNAIRIKQALENGWIKVFRHEKIGEFAQRIEGIANNCFFHDGRPLELIHYGEAEALALNKIINASVVVIDERTARSMLEYPLSLKKSISLNFNASIKMNKGKLKELKEFCGQVRIVRSVELMAEAFDLGLLEKELGNSIESLKASLYALKYKGCAVSLNEIESYIKETEI